MDKIFQLESDSDFKNGLDALFNSLGDFEQETFAKDELRDILFKNNLIPEKINELLITKGFNEDRINYFQLLVDKKKHELCYLALISHNSLCGETVINFDWNLKLIYGTSELLKLKYPIVQLILETTGKSKQKVFDIDSNSLAKIINALEEITAT